MGVEPPKVGSNDGLGPNATGREAFLPWEIEQAIRQFLEFGEAQFGDSHHGYYSGSGWAARCLRYHVDELTGATVLGLGA